MLAAAPSRRVHRGGRQCGADRRPGTGKTHIATDLGMHAVQHHHKEVRLFATVNLVIALEQEKAFNKAGQLAEGCCVLI